MVTMFLMYFIAEKEVLRFDVRISYTNATFV